MRAAAKAEILPFRPINREAGRAKAPPKRRLFERLTRLLGDIFRRRRRAQLRSQLQVVHRWERSGRLDGASL